jgi:hypothetical protein
MKGSHHAKRACLCVEFELAGVDEAVLVNIERLYLVLEGHLLKPVGVVRRRPQ